MGYIGNDDEVTERMLFPQGEPGTRTEQVPVLTEGWTAQRQFITRWFCEVPGDDARFRVLAENWGENENGTPVRDIYSIEISQAVKT